MTSQRTQAAVQIVSNLPAPRFTDSGACRPCGLAGWLALLLTKAGDVKTNLSVQVSAKHNTQIPGPAIYTLIPDSHSHNTTPTLPTLVQAPYPLPKYTTHTTATKTQTYVQHSPVPVLIFTQSMNALSDHHINRCFDMYVIQL